VVEPADVGHGVTRFLLDLSSWSLAKPSEGILGP
jgi:hypothetical protein